MTRMLVSLETPRRKLVSASGKSIAHGPSPNPPRKPPPLKYVLNRTRTKLNSPAASSTRMSSPSGCSPRPNDSNRCAFNKPEKPSNPISVIAKSVIFAIPRYFSRLRISHMLAFASHSRAVILVGKRRCKPDIIIRLQFNRVVQIALRVRLLIDHFEEGNRCDSIARKSCMSAQKVIRDTYILTYMVVACDEHGAFPIITLCVG